MGCGGSVGLELRWPALAFQIACGSCLAHSWCHLDVLLWDTAKVLDWSLVVQDYPGLPLIPIAWVAISSGIAMIPITRFENAFPVAVIFLLFRLLLLLLPLTFLLCVPSHGRSWSHLECSHDKRMHQETRLQKKMLHMLGPSPRVIVHIYIYIYVYIYSSV